MTALTLLGSGTSPFVRKSRIAADLLGVEIDFVLTSQWQPDGPAEEANPLSRVPTLITEDLGPMYDSRVIVAELERRAGAKLYPSDEVGRILEMRREALADGLCETTITYVQEGWRLEAARSDFWTERQDRKIRGTLRMLESNADEMDTALYVGAVMTAVALDFLDFWVPSMAWQDNHPRLAAWHETVTAHPSFEMTRPYLPEGAQMPQL